MQFDFGQPRFEHVVIPIIIALLKIGFVFAKNIAAGSHRFGFGDFRSRTPGPPPFSSMNSMPAAASSLPDAHRKGARLGSFRKKRSPAVLTPQAGSAGRGWQIRPRRWSRSCRRSGPLRSWAAAARCRRARSTMIGPRPSEGLGAGGRPGGRRPRGAGQAIEIRGDQH
jgi:hypothetical protein